MNSKAYLGGAILLAAFGLAKVGCFSAGSPCAYYASGARKTPSEVNGPLKARIATAQKGRDVLFAFQLTDAQGSAIRHLESSSGRPEPPRVEVLDSGGKRVYECRLKYG